MHGELDLADALDLEVAVQRGAEELKALGNEESLDVRRSLAVGMLARGQATLEFDDPGAGEPVGGFEAPLALRTPATEDSTPTTAKKQARQSVVLYVHLSEDAIRSRDANAPAWVENAGGHLVTAGQVARWCGRPDTTSVTVKRVVDLNETMICAGYQPSDQLAEQVRLRDGSCVFPRCHRPAKACDLDHIIPRGKAVLLRAGTSPCCVASTTA